MGQKHSVPATQCQTCDALALFILYVKQSGPLPHHESFKQLEASAAQGCELCRYLRNVLIVNCSSYAALLSSEAPIKVRKSHWSENSYVVNCGLIEGRFPAPTRPRIYPHLISKVSSASQSEMLLETQIQRDLFDVGLALIWLSHCLTTHIHCARNDVKHAPRRLIDVGYDGGSTPKLVLVGPELTDTWLENGARLPADGHAFFYCTLSYCWGPNKRAAALTRENESRYLEMLPWDELPKTIQDAIEFIRRLKFRYLWVDALCIIQPTDDDRLDWEEESARMSDIYRNSLCTIAATGATRAEEGCFIERPIERYALRDCKLSLPQLHLRNCLPSLRLKCVPPSYLSITRSPLSRRGWVFQEQALSPRTLHFTKDGLFWECRLGCASQWFPEIDHQMKHYGLEPCRLMSGALFEGLSHDIIWFTWFHLVEEYSTRNLSNITDKLIAFSGIAREFQRHTGDEYLAGLWRSSLLRCLMWSRRDLDAGGYRKGREVLNEASELSQVDCGYLAPSWSWASKRSTHVTYGLIPDTVQWHAVINAKDTFVILATSINPTGAVVSGQLSITAPIITIVVGPKAGSDIFANIADTLDPEATFEHFTTISPIGGTVSLHLDDPAETIDHPFLCICLYSFEGTPEGLVISAVNVSQNKYARKGTFCFYPADVFPMDEIRTLIII
jgi:hypothetical protein